MDEVSSFLGPRAGDTVLTFPGPPWPTSPFPHSLSTYWGPCARVQPVPGWAAMPSHIDFQYVIPCNPPASRSALGAMSSQLHRTEGKPSKWSRPSVSFNSLPTSVHSLTTPSQEEHRDTHILLHGRYSSFGTRKCLCILAISSLAYLSE